MNRLSWFFWGVLLLLGGILVSVIWPYLFCLAVVSVAIYAVYLGVEVAHKMQRSGYDSIVLTITPILIIVSGLGVGFAYLGTPILIPVGVVPLLGMALYPRFRHRRLVADYKRSAKYLIQP